MAADTVALLERLGIERPEAWRGLVAKVNELDRAFAGWTADQLAAIEIVRLRGGGVEGDSNGLPDSELRGTIHLSIVGRAD